MFGVFKLSRIYYSFFMDFSVFRRKVGRKIRDLRLQRNLTQEDMDEGDSGIPYRTIQNIEAGRSNPSLKTIHKLAKIFQIKPKDLLDV